MATRHQMSSADAAWLHMDRPTNLMVINGVLWFESPIDWERLKRTWVTRIVERFPPFRRRVVEPRLGPPAWEDDPAFDPALHFHHIALPAPGDASALQALVADLMVVPLDRSKPLWHMHLIDGYGDGCAAVVRMHHCISDGVALARVMLTLADDKADAPLSEAGIAEAQPARRPRLPLGPLRPLASAASTAAHAGVAVAHEATESLLHPGHLAELARSAGGDASALAHVLGARPEPASALRGEPGVARQVAWTAPVPLHEVRDAAHIHGGTVNDMLVAAVTGALAAHLADAGTPLDEMHAMVPFNLRPLDRPLPAELGNRFGLLTLALPTGEPDARSRLREVKRRMGALKTSREGAVSYGVLSALGVAPPQVESRVIDVFSATASTVLTNVPGPRETVFIAGTPLAGVLVWAPCSGSIGMTISIFSYAGTVTVGLMTDAVLVPDPSRIVARIEEELRELLALAPAED